MCMLNLLFDLISDLLCCYKIIFGLVRTNLFAERVINTWNGLPANRIDFSSYPRFQSSLQHCVLTAS